MTIVKEQALMAKPNLTINRCIQSAVQLAHTNSYINFGLVLSRKNSLTGCLVLSNAL